MIVVTCLLYILAGVIPKEAVEGMKGDGLRIKESLVGRKVNPDNPHEVSFPKVNFLFLIPA